MVLFLLVGWLWISFLYGGMTLRYPSRLLRALGPTGVPASFSLGRGWSSQVEFPPTETEGHPYNFMFPSHAVTRVDPTSQGCEGYGWCDLPVTPRPSVNVTHHG